MTEKLIRKFLTAKIDRASGDADARMTISTPDVDREGDILVPEGVVLDDYRKNPIVLFVHETDRIPVARSTKIDVIPGRGIEAEWVWLENDPVADRVRNAFEQGVLNAASVGFQPLAYEPTATGYRYTKWALLEWSICPLPANPNATRVLKSLGFDDHDDAIDLDALMPVIRRAIGETVTSALNKHLGRIDDGGTYDGTPVSSMWAAPDDTIELPDDIDIKQLVSDVIDAEIARRMGRVD